MSTLVKRTLSALIFSAIMVSGILFHPVAYAAVMLLCIGIMTLEFYRMSLAGWNRTGQIFGFFSSVFLFVTTYIVAGYGLVTARFFLLFMPLPVTAAWITILYSKSEEVINLRLFCSCLSFTLPFPFLCAIFLFFLL